MCLETPMCHVFRLFFWYHSGPRPQGCTWDGSGPSGSGVDGK